MVHLSFIISPEINEINANSVMTEILRKYLRVGFQPSIWQN